MKYDDLNRMVEWRKMGMGGPKVKRNIYRGVEWHRLLRAAKDVERTR